MADVDALRAELAQLRGELHAELEELRGEVEALRAIPPEALPRDPEVPHLRAEVDALSGALRRLRGRVDELEEHAGLDGW